MAITARELVFFIRAENQASGVLRKVARDLRALPSSKQLKVQSAAADQTVRQVNSGARVISLAKQELDLKGKNLATQKAMVDAQLRQATIAQKYNAVQAATARNAQNILSAQNRVSAAADKIGNIPQEAEAVKADNAARSAALQQQMRRNANAVSKAQSAADEAQSKLDSFPVTSSAAKSVTVQEQRAAQIRSQIENNARAMEQAQAQLAIAQQAANRAQRPTSPGYIPDTELKQLETAQAEVAKLDLESEELAKDLDEVRIAAAEAAKALTDGMARAEASLATAQESLGILNRDTELLSEKEVQLAKDAIAAGEAQVAAANAARAAYEIAAGTLELYRVKQIELGNALDQVKLKAQSEALAIKTQTEAASAAKIETITQAFSRLGRTAQIAGVLVAAAVGLAAHQAATFQSQTTLAATQARPVGAPVAQTAAIQQKINDEVLKQMKEFPAASKDMADSFYEIFSGTNVQSVSKAANMLKVFNEMAVAGGTDLKTMTNAGISLYNNFPHEFKNMTDAANQFFAAVRYARTTPAQFANSLSSVLPVAKAAGLQFRDVADAMALITRQTGGAKTSQDATGLARLIEMISRPDVIKGLSLSGINVEQANGKLKPLLTIITQIYDKFVATGKLKPGPDTLNFFKSISAAGSPTGQGTAGTIQGRRSFDQLLTNIKAYQTVSKQVNSDQNEFVRSFDAMAQSPGVKWATLTNQLKALAIVIGEQAIPAFVQIGQPIVRLLKWFNDLSDGAKKDIAQWMVYGSVGAIVAGFFVKISSAFARWLLLLKLGKTASATSGIAEVGSEAGAVSVQLGLMLGVLGLVIGAFILWPHQTMAVINALGGLENVLIAVGAAIVGAKLGIWGASVLPEVTTAVKGLTASLALMTEAEGVALVASVSLDAALAFLASPAVIGAGIALIAFGLYKMFTQASQTTKALKDLKKAISDTSTARANVPQLDLNLDQAQNQLAEAKAALAKTTTGTLAWKEAVDNVLTAMNGVKDAQGAIKSNQQKINQGLQQQLVSVLKLASASAAKNKPENKFTSILEGSFLFGHSESTAELAADATKDFVTQVDNLAQSLSKTEPLYSHNLFLIEQMTQAIGHVPSEKVLKMLLDNKSLDKQLKDYVNQMPAEFKQALEDAGTIMGTNQGIAWLNAINAQMAKWNPYQTVLPGDAGSPFDTPNATNGAGPIATQGRYPGNPIGDVPSEYQQEQAKQAAAAAKTAASNAAYMTNLQKVAALDLKYIHSGSLKDEQAFYNAKSALDKKYGDSYDAYTSDYLAKATDTTKKAETAQEKAAKAAVSTAQQTWTQAAQSLQSTFSSLQQQNQSNFGTLFQGPVISGPKFQTFQQWGGKVTGGVLLSDLKAQVAQFKNYNSMVNKLARMKNVPYDLLQQLYAAGPAAIDDVRALLSLPKNKLQQYFTTFDEAYGKNGLIEQATQAQFKVDLSHYQKMGKSIALAIIQGLQSVGTPNIDWFENLIKSWFPSLAKAAKGKTKPITKGALGGIPVDKTPKHMPEVPKTTPKKIVTRRTVRLGNDLATNTKGVLATTASSALYIDPKTLAHEIALATKKEWGKPTTTPTKSSDKGNNHPVEQHVHYHVTAPSKDSNLEAQIRRAHFVQRNKLRLDKN